MFPLDSTIHIQVTTVTSCSLIPSSSNNTYIHTVRHTQYAGMKCQFLQQIYWNWHYTPERANYEGKTEVAEKPLRLHCLLETEHAQIDIKLHNQYIHTAL